MLRLGCDLDGVVADLEGALMREAHRLWPSLDPSNARNTDPDGRGGDDEELTEEEREVAPPTLALTAHQQHEIWGQVHRRVNFWETLEELERGVVSRLADVARAKRWEVIFLTSRPHSAGDTVQAQSQRWLARCGFAMPSVFVVHGSRGKIADALDLDVVIDDRPENCLDIVLESKARAILVWRGDIAAVPGRARQLGIGTVSSLDACLTILEEADPRSTDGPRLVDRLKRLLGLRSTDPGVAAR